MHIRRLQLDFDSDEEQADVPPQPHKPTHQAPNPTNSPPEPVIISDEDFVDVSDDPSPPSPPPAPVPQPHAPGCPVSYFLRRLGLGLKREWLADCLRALQGSVRGFEGLDVAAHAKLCFEQFLFADMNFCGGGVLPANVDSMHLDVLPGPYVLQVDEILNMSCPLRGRYQKANPGVKRCLKLSMTDGVQRVFGMEYRPIQALDVCAPSGLKVSISNVKVRRGLLMLDPETVQIKILGGLVEQLDAARQRLVKELNKPPRGTRTKNGVLPPLSTRATLAAWPSSRVDDPGHTAPMLHSTDSVHTNNQGAGLSMPHTGHRLTSEDTLPMGEQNAASNSIPHTVSNAEARNMDVHRGTYPVSSDNSMGNQFPSSFARAEVHVDTPYITRQNSVGNQSSHAHSNVAATHGDTIHVTRESSVATMCSPIAENVETDKYRNRIPVTTITDSTPLRGSSSTVSTTDDILMGDASDHPLILSPEPGNIIRESSVGNQSSHVHSNVAVADKDNVHVTWESSVATKCSPIAENVVTNHDKIPVITISDNVPLRGSSAVSNTDDVLMVDAASDHPLMMSGDREVPFTYLASLSAKWAAMKEKSRLVQGKIKCFLTGVKGFQYKKRTTYELQAYVDDGSLISEIIIDHDVVQKGIGYSPQEVTAALSSTDMKTVQNMKETMRKFQAFLANFEGIIRVEFNRKSPIPLALEMNQGCPQSDAWLLMRRLKSLDPAQVQNHSPLDPIYLSP
ncbi:recQ-mediated genome instability protein 1 isoform X2 [Lotus japonicus]|uniref:recQ-mediated genome instability protein 1 isoform X2 n=1 Tax=Lotus japonicus TaxID=34305 RepID=UPI002583BF99|nr:recQ-mediated genome instability protein 1 isoform X2 [Lotus japonicus]